MLEGIGGQRAAAPVSWQQGHDGAGHAVQGERPDIVDRSVSRGSGEPSSFGRVGLRATGEHRYQQPRGSGCVAGQAMFPALCGSNRRYASVGTRRRRLSTVKNSPGAAPSQSLDPEPPHHVGRSRGTASVGAKAGQSLPSTRAHPCRRQNPARAIGRFNVMRERSDPLPVRRASFCNPQGGTGAATEGFRRARDTAPCVRVGLVARIRSPGMRGRVHDPSPGRAMP
jgi:hypothetical protein